MPFNGSGTFNRTFPPGGWQGDAAAQIKIKADRHDQHDSDLASGLSNVICKDGQSTITANIPWNSKKITGLANPDNPQDAATKAYVDAIRGWATSISLTGSFPESLVKFTGSTGPWGDSYVTADLAYGVRGTDWVWNDKADFSGTDVMKLTEIGDLTITRKDDGAATGPYILLERNSASPAALDGLGAIFFNGRNSASAAKSYADIYARIEDATSASEDASVVHEIMVAGAMAQRLTLNAAGVTLGNAATSGYFYANGGRFVADATTAMLAAGKTNIAGTVFIRPNGQDNASGQAYIDQNGDLACARQVYAAVPSLGAVFGLYYDGDRHLKWAGGSTLTFQTSTGTVWLDTNGGRKTTWSTNGDVVVYAQAWKPGGGDWANSSDERIKTVSGDYTTGLDAVKGLRPVRYTYLGNDTIEPPANQPTWDEEGNRVEPTGEPTVPYPNSPHYQVATDGREFIGFVAQEVEAVMPGMISQHEGFINGEAVPDIRDIDTSNLIYALVNAVKELAAKVEALEARP